MGEGGIDGADEIRIWEFLYVSSERNGRTLTFQVRTAS